MDWWHRVDDGGVYRVATKSDLDEEPKADGVKRYVLKAPIAVGTGWQATTTACLLRRRQEFPPEIRHPAVVMTYTIEALDDKVRCGRCLRTLRARGRAGGAQASPTPWWAGASCRSPPPSGTAMVPGWRVVRQSPPTPPPGRRHADPGADRMELKHRRWRAAPARRCGAGAPGRHRGRARAAQPPERFPQRPLTLWVPWLAGGATDLTMRLLASLASQPGQKVIVENRSAPAVRW
ncbi:MAG: hypothetical protein U1F56_13825 [Rubrivivax sp.]